MVVRRGGAKRSNAGGHKFAMTIDAAVRALQEGNLVVVPTETVYGLAANALDKIAVAKIFKAKNRPPQHPLIVHVLDLDAAAKLAEITPHAGALAKAYWPGPMTLVMKKKAIVPSLVSGDLDTVAVRAPSHPILRELLSKTGFPLAAPSANVFTEVSPTTAAMISDRIRDHIAGIVDAGACEIGIESTVVDCSVDTPVVLRYGPISVESISEVLRLPITAYTQSEKSPGTHPKHYAPPYRVVIVDNAHPDAPALVFQSSDMRIPHRIRMPAEPAAYAAKLYAALARLGAMRIEEVQVEAPPKTAEWDAIWDRLNRMSG